MKKIFFTLFLLNCIFLKGIAQCTGTVLSVINPSFEGTPGLTGTTPPNWDICQPGKTPDTQPGCWGITLPPANGSSYVGFCNQASQNWQEGAGQTLSSPMIAGTTYTFTIDLATTNSIQGGITPGCVQMLIYGNMGANGGCDISGPPTSELLWSSGNVTSLTWQIYTVNITPTQNWTNILFMSNNMGCADNPYIMLDNMSQITPIVDVPQFTFTNVCIGDSMPFTDQSTSAQGTINSWNWDFGDGSSPVTTQNPAHLYASPGNYNVTLTVTSTVPCTTTVTHTVTVYALPPVTISPASDSICSGSSATLTANGATTYSWSGGLGTANPVTVTPTVNTIYTVTGTSNGCTSTANVTVTVNSLPNVTANPASPNLCPGSSIAITAGGASTYSWSPAAGLNTTTGNNVVANPSVNTIYTVTGTDVAGCTNATNVTVNVNPSLNVIVNPIPPLICYGSSIDLTAGGASTYIWSPAYGLSSTTGSTVTASPTATTIYTVVGTDASTLCTGTAQITVTIDPAIISSIAGTNVTCFNGTNGAADLTVTGGIAPFSYNWNNGAFTTEDLVNVPAGTYTVIVSDGNSCTSSSSVTLNQPTQNINASIVATNVGCYGAATGAANLTVFGGTPGYTYHWNNGVTTEDLSNIPYGNYCVTVTDAAGCSTSVCTTVTQPASPLSASIAGTNLTCYNVCTGLGVCSPTGGTPGYGGYTYHWSFGGIVKDSLIGACAGSYTCTVTDGAGCTTVASIIITQPPQPATINLKPIDIPCYGECIGEIDLTYADIHPTNSYLWSNGNTTQDLLNVCAGYYSVTITDSAGCTRVADTLIAQPLMPLQDSIVVKNVSCYFGSDGDINLTVFGGTPGYLYVWLPSHDSIQDVHNIFLGTDSLVFTVTITDANACSTTNKITIHQPHAPLTATITGTTIKCNGESTGAINLTPAGGTQGNGYQYIWNTTAITENLANLPAGFYQVTITDVHGCDTIYSFTLTQPPPLIMSLTPKNTSCTYDCTGGITSTVGGGTPSTILGYTYNWSNGSISHDDTLLCVGSYSLTVTDSLGCTYKDSTMIFSNSTITVNGSANPITGVSPVDVSFTSTVTGTLGATSYLWDFGDGNSSTDPNPVHTFVTPVSSPGETNTFNVMLVVKDSLCSDTFFTSIEVKPASDLTIPNVFTPNGDGKNDLFLVKGVAIETFSCSIFNRWGKKVFEWNDVSNGWDGNVGGKKASDGVYYYILKAHGTDGKDFNSHGTVTLIR